MLKFYGDIYYSQSNTSRGSQMLKSYSWDGMMHIVVKTIICICHSDESFKLLLHCASFHVSKQEHSR